MPPTYEQNKSHIYNWRAKNPDKYRANVRKAQKKYENWKKIQKVFLNILLL
jgi:hypothetical protein